MGKGGGSDLYFFKCEKKDGPTVYLSFRSEQDCGVPREPGFWASQFSSCSSNAYEMEFGGGFRYVPKCTLARYYCRRLPSGNIKVENVKKEGLATVQSLLSSFGGSSVSGSSGPSSQGLCGASIGYNSPMSAAAAVIALDGTRPELSFDGKGLKVSTEIMPPSIYDYSEAELAQGVIESVEFSDEEEHEHGRATANVVVKFCNEKFCEHVEVGSKWEGR